jgi:alginate O-acetyltransferase complex protein AlgI
MEITSLIFALLTIVSGFVYYLLPQKFRIAYLTILSCGFIASYSYYLLGYIVLYTLINYFLGIKIQYSKFKIALFRTGVLINLSQLLILKYASFIIDPIFNLFNSNIRISQISEIIIPVGVSYFTLQGIGYLINVKMGWEKPERKFMNFLLYIIFFPKFLSGPIERSNHFLPQVRLLQPLNDNNITSGLRIALLGFFKKLIIANHLAPFIGNIYSNIDSVGGIFVWLLILIQPLYLYFDFSGYSDIAIGFAKLFGIDLIQNFNKPFLSENLTTFWKRFHISLSSWFNDYIFRQVSFRFRKWKNYASLVAVIITWMLFGIWHGAGWNFMILGFVLAGAIIYEYYTKNVRFLLFSKFPVAVRVYLGRIFTYLFYGCALIFFFSPDLLSAFKLLSKLKSSSNYFFDGNLILPSLFGTSVALSLALAYLSYEIIQNDFKYYYLKLHGYWIGHRTARIIIYYIILFMIISELSGNSTFVYQMF